MLFNAHNIIIDRGIGSPGHGNYVVDCLNATDKIYLPMLLTTVHLPNDATNNPQTVMHTETEKSDISIEK